MAPGKKTQDHIQKVIKTRAGSIAQIVECLLNNDEDLSLNSSIQKKKGERDINFITQEDTLNRRAEIVECHGPQVPFFQPSLEMMLSNLSHMF